MDHLGDLLSGNHKIILIILKIKPKWIMDSPMLLNLNLRKADYSPSSNIASKLARHIVLQHILKESHCNSMRSTKLVFVLNIRLQYFKIQFVKNYNFQRRYKILEESHSAPMRSL